MAEKRQGENGSEPVAKRPTLSESGPLTLEDVDEFQKEAIWRQMNYYRRERDVASAALKNLEITDDKASALLQELEDVTKKYIEASKQVERLKSPTVQRCAPDQHTSNAEVKEEQKDTNSNEAPSEELQQKLASQEEELKGLKGISDIRDEQLAKADERIAELEAQIRDFEVRLSSLPEDVVRKSDIYVGVERQLRVMFSENQRLESELQSLRRDLGNAKAEQAAFELNVRDRFDTERQQLEKRLAQAEADVTRIRGARDELLSELSIAKSGTAEREITLRRYKELVAELEARIKAVERTEPPPVDDTEPAPDASVEDLKETIKKLTRQNKALAAEIPGLEQAFAKAHKKSSLKMSEITGLETKLSEAATSKVKADERYFGAMRAKDALNAEFIRAKAALTKSSEIVADLRESEARITSQLSKSRRELAESEAAKAKLQSQCAYIETKRVDAEARVSAREHTIDSLQQQLNDKEAALQAAGNQRRRNEQQIEKLRRQAETHRLTSGAGGSAAIQEQLESLRSIALCSVCQKNWKDTAIKICGHVFCGDCVHSRLAARMRKCPMCNCSFGQGDILTVHL